MNLTACAPNGSPIIGQLTIIHHAVSLVSGFKPIGTDDYDHINFTGETKINWDSQQSVRRGGELIFVDVNGEEWPMSQLIFKEI